MFTDPAGLSELFCFFGSLFPSITKSYDLVTVSDVRKGSGLSRFKYSGHCNVERFQAVSRVAEDLVFGDLMSRRMVNSYNVRR